MAKRRVMTSLSHFEVFEKRKGKWVLIDSAGKPGDERKPGEKWKPRYRRG